MHLQVGISAGFLQIVSPSMKPGNKLWIRAAGETPSQRKSVPGIIDGARERAYEHDYESYIRKRVASRRNELIGLRGWHYFIRRWRIEFWAWRGARRAARARIQSQSEV